jgi:hypothetical protein
MKEIPLTRDQLAIVDDHWIDRLSRYNWACSPNGYAYMRFGASTLYMHRLIAKTPKGMETDHINRNRLDNRESNLRNVTHAENCQNRGPWRAARYQVPLSDAPILPPEKALEIRILCHIGISLNRIAELCKVSPAIISVIVSAPLDSAHFGERFKTNF